MTETEIPIRESHLPEPRYRCAGIGIFHPAPIADVHPRFVDDGFRKADELFWVTLEDRECEESCTDFFCQGCIEAMGRRTGGKKTLQRALEEKIGEAGQQVMRAMKLAGAGR